MCEDTEYFWETVLLQEIQEFEGFLGASDKHREKSIEEETGIIPSQIQS